jgi:hypothetical protein
MAPPEVALRAAAEQHLDSSRIVRAIFKGRELILRSRPDATPRPEGLLELTKSMGWGVLAESSREIVLGMIDAPTANVWPWLVQMGCQRAGWYSWDRLDNGGTPSADHIIPELQHLAVGDVLPFRPQGPDGFDVVRIVPERALVVHSKGPLYEGTWAFVLEPHGDRTRMVTRYRATYEPSATMAVMPRKQCRAARDRSRSSSAA